MNALAQAAEEGNERGPTTWASPILGDRLKGVVLLARSTPFDSSELRTLLNLSGLVAVALEHPHILGLWQPLSELRPVQ